jgi:S-adenosylmethionine-diacylglycerol 3-amino-3-carboxypropyl transferase
LHNKGLTAQFLKALRKLTGVDSGWIRMMHQLGATERAEQIERTFGPLRQNKVVGAFLRSPVQLMALGVNYAQRDRMLAAEQHESMIDFFYNHVLKLAETDLELNWFVWYVITGQFNHDHPDACPPYLRKTRHEQSHRAETKMGFHHGNIFDVLERAGRDTWSHYMFCDAPDWMPHDVQRRLLDNVLRTSRDGAVVLWRSVEDDTIVQTHGLGRHFQLMQAQTDEASRLDRSRQYRRVNFYQVVH